MECNRSKLVTTSDNNFSTRPATKTNGVIEVAKTSAGQSIAIPFVKIVGARPGPTLVVNAAMHGTEIIGTTAISRFYNECDPSRVAGTFIGVPILSTWAFEAENRLPTMFDHFDIEQLFPGEPDGSITSRLAFVFTNEIASRADFLIDMHGQDQYWQPTRAAIVPVPETVNPAVYEKCLELARAFGVDQIWRIKKPGNIAEVMIRKKSIPAISTEFGGVTDFSRTEEYLRDATTGLENVMRYLGMLERGGSGDKTNSPKIMNLHDVHNRNGGMWTTTARVGDSISKDQELGTISDPITGEIIERIKAPVDGDLALVWCLPMIKPGSSAIGVGEITMQ